MPEFGFDTLSILIFASLVAGCIDAISGGGGLITVPTMFALFPGAPPALLLGTNKGAAVCGTAVAATRYVRRVEIDWVMLAPAMTLALVGSAIGAHLLTILSPEGLRKALPFILLLVLITTLRKKQMVEGGAEFALSSRQRIVRGGFVGGLVGVYDGFFGPGTGTFFVFLLVRLLGYDFLRSTAKAKWLNLGTNISALIVFATNHQIHWGYMACMGVANMIGSAIGTRLALRGGAELVRIVFIIVVSVLLLKTCFDAYT